MNLDNISATARILIRRPPAEAFAAFAEAEKMSQFWFSRRDDGLKAGEKSTWYIGSGENEFAFDVLVREFDPPNRIVIEWDNQGHMTQVAWSFAKTEDGNTDLLIEETGYGGSDDEIIASAIDSKGGFNQVIVAAKALIEHGVSVNVVKDHA